MNLSPKSTEPTPLQARAIEILTYTFPLLSSTFQPVYCPTWISSGQMLAPSSEQSAGASATGAQSSANATNNAAQQNQRNPPPAGPQLPNFPFRAFAIPFLMLSLRTVFLLYIFSPARKPIFALILTVWLMWELWTAAQGILAEERAAQQPGVANAQRNRNNDAANGAARPNARPLPNGNNQPGAGNQNRWAPHHAVVDRLAAFHLREEGDAFDAPENGAITRTPSLYSRLKQAMILFVLTIHPEVWNLRRRSLREREARVKRELAERRRQHPEGGESESEQGQNQPRPQAEPELQGRRRAPWLEDYIQRVERAEWIDG